MFPSRYTYLWKHFLFKAYLENVYFYICGSISSSRNLSCCSTKLALAVAGEDASGTPGEERQLDEAAGEDASGTKGEERAEGPGTA